MNVTTGYAHFAERAPQAGAYGLAKAPLNVLTRMIAAEAGAAIKVNSMSPGWVWTDLRHRPRGIRRHTLPVMLH